MSKNEIFGAVAGDYYDKGLAPIPLGLPTDGDSAKGAKVKGWQDFGRNRYEREELDRWVKRFAVHNIGLAMGSLVGEDLQLVGIDIDLDEFREKVERAMPALVSGKRGKKGATWFALAPASWKISRYQVSRGDKKVSAVEVLTFGAQTAIPPSVHPDTGEPYAWLGTPLTEADLRSLPVLNDGFKLELQAIVKGQDQYYNGGTLKEGTPDAQEVDGLNTMTWLGPGGGGNTHDVRLRAIGYMVATGWTDVDILARVRRAMEEAEDRSGEFPMDWAIVDRDNKQFVDGARAKGYDKTSKHGKGGEGKAKKMPPERVYANWAQNTFDPIVHNGHEFRKYTDGHWPVFDPGMIEKRMYEQDPVLKHSEANNAIKILSKQVLNPTFFSSSMPAICLHDGTLDIYEMTVRPWREEDRILHQLDFGWSDVEECPNYEKVVTEAFAGCEDSIRTYEEFCGLTLIDEMKFQKVLFIIGPGGSGKSTMANILESMHPSTAVASVPLTELHDIRLRTMLVGKFVNISSEQSRMNTVSDVQFKQITGGDFVTVRSLYEEAENVKLKVRFLGVQNEFPQTSDVSYAMQRRLIILQTPNSVENPDPDMGTKLFTERPAILRRWVKALNALLKRGKFEPPASSQMLVQEYIMENSPVQLWITEHCELVADESKYADVNDLYSDFKEWAQNNGYRHPITKTFFKKKLTELGHKCKPCRLTAGGGKVEHIYEGWPVRVKQNAGLRGMDSRV